MDAAAWDARYAAHEHVWSLGPNAFVVAELEALPPGRALDLAGGEGRNALWLAERGWTVTMVEFSRVGLEKARRLAADRGVTLELVEADVTRYEPEPDAYDLVLVSYLQTEAVGREAWLGHVTDALAPGGTVLILAHDASNIEHGYGGPQDPSALTTPEDVASRLTANDPELTIDRADVVERTVETPDGERIALDHLVRAHR
jgi:ubiquinone/menaquinone biosynthesis C-methylase UbiE